MYMNDLTAAVVTPALNSAQRLRVLPCVIFKVPVDSHLVAFPVQCFIGYSVHIQCMYMRTWACIEPVQVVQKLVCTYMYSQETYK